MRATSETAVRRSPGLLLAIVVLISAESVGGEPTGAAPGRGAPQAGDYARDVQPLLSKYCYDCHGEGSSRGDVELDKHASDDARRKDARLWTKVSENLRADLMPPAGKPRPTSAERSRLLDWIRRDVHRVDCRAPDPGPATLRRLNRYEYNQTVRDLFGIEVDPGDAFPLDDTGYGFDNIGDVLSVSPVLMEKYFNAAQHVVKAVVADKPGVPVDMRAGKEFTLVDEPSLGVQVREKRFELDRAGRYDARVRFNITSFSPYEGEVRIRALLDGKEVGGGSYAAKNRYYSYSSRMKLAAGPHVWQWVVDQSKATPKGSVLRIDITLDDVSVRGPLGVGVGYPAAHRRLFFKGPPPRAATARRSYAREVLRRVADRAFRRPVEEATLDSLVALVDVPESRQRAGDFERGVARALEAILVSPRFIFRSESPADSSPGRSAALDDWALASRLSYLLWSSIPDEALRAQAAAGTLRTSLREEAQRMLADPKADRFVSSFVGQWLRTRDVEGLGFDVSKFKKLKPLLRKAMRDETELLFAHIIREDRDLLELLTANYTFLNEQLAEVYGIPGVRGFKMRQVPLPADSVRGGILTQASFLLVTSNFTRTSPVKRGLFVLENLLGAPPPPPPADIPSLEEAGAEKDKNKKRTMREQMELHRAKPSCAGCHARMDPIGLGLEGFDAVGAWRERDEGGVIDPRGKLVTGESFTGVRELRALLASRKEGFYRTLTRKLLTYALGRGLTPADECTVDDTVGRLLREGGRFSALLLGIVESPAFQLRPHQEPS